MKVGLKNLYFSSMSFLFSSLWPFMVSMLVFSFLLSSVYSWHYGGSLFFLILVFLIFGAFLWFSDVLYENFSGWHTLIVCNGLYFGMILFILSEVCFFFSFFWGYFHKVFYPSESLGGMWPPVGFSKIIVDPFSIPLLNTMLLLSSGVFVTYSHHSLIGGLKYIKSLFITMVLGLMFLFLQLFEYSNSFYSFNSTMYGSVFFMLTGFHGMHVLVGGMMLIVCLVRGFYFHYSKNYHVSLVLSIWYWHFVDVVWLFLYMFLYWYGS